MSTLLRRALLYVPGSSSRMLEKSRLLNVDCVSYDLEDSVTPALKPLARENIRQLLQTPKPAGIRERAVRINSVSSGLAEVDLHHVLKSGPVDAIVLPKVESAAEIKLVSDILTYHNHPSTTIIALIESARSILNIREICNPPTTTTPTATPTTRLSGLIFAAEDYSLSLGLTRTPSLTEMLYARQTIVTAAAAYNLSAIDLVCTDYKDTTDRGPLARECIEAAGMGFTGKQVIHPSQVELTQRLFMPQRDRVEWAVRVLVANERAEREGRGAWTLEGKMVDAPVVGFAEKLVKKAELAGIDTQALREQFRDVKPE